ncbi:tol-pal system protein YbgF [Tamilnaduibacter salinus]|uniref:Cell division coordinator CpoB n=1 Tax=Tamilnaduibacter salinus TaxID=1484056 RepID=A0A2A2I6M0_9GAMM|nr:tol-pal system protein YbgF [Tamilnaduibacter salinus]PAV26946.1 tol-pal system protein YbgF [Tamilnaduibacter salinus]PVY78350.1 tol-pal system protein YbgF [Tamilnaduibacter salinus]
MNQWGFGLVALLISGAAIAQQSVPAYQSADSEARRQASSNPGVAELYFLVEELKREVSQLRGRVEEQQHQLDQLSRQARERYIDLDQRLLDLSSQQAQTSDAGGAATSASASDGANTGGASVVEMTEYRAPSAEEKQAYQAIMTLIQEKKDFPAAVDALYEFLDTYPQGDRTVNAYYWLGEVYLAMPKLEQARQAFSIVTNRFEDHRKGPDALFKLGVTQARMDESEAARETLRSVGEKYPGSNAAGLAKDYLAGMGASGSES